MEKNYGVTSGRLKSCTDTDGCSGKDTEPKKLEVKEPFSVFILEQYHETQDRIFSQQNTIAEEIEKILSFAQKLLGHDVNPIPEDIIKEFEMFFRSTDGGENIPAANFISKLHFFHQRLLFTEERNGSLIKTLKAVLYQIETFI